VTAWWAYWLTVAVGTVLWIGVAVVGGREGNKTVLGQPIWAAILLAPIFLAGLKPRRLPPIPRGRLPDGGGATSLAVGPGRAGLLGSDPSR
jgi:hypothetical protein